MCGIAGIFQFQKNPNTYFNQVQKMATTLQHRGPDYTNILNIDTNCTLAHTRLKIIDLSDAANQPMSCYQNRFFIVFNGEIYNYKELRTELQRVQYQYPFPPYPFKTQSDTEAILAAYHRWGKACTQYLDGMFAFAIYDKQTQELFIARDRQGKKPLYYIHTNKLFAFASEIRSIIASGLSSQKINHHQLYDYFQYQTNFAPNTLIQDIQLLPSAHYAIIQSNGDIQIKPYWKPNIHTSKENDINLIHQNIKNLLFQSVEKRLISDVPVGAFLSGGIDSSAIVGIMKQIHPTNVNTFHVTTEYQNFSEQTYAENFSKQLHTHHHTIVLKKTDILNLVLEALEKMDYPSGDGINTYIVSKATKNAGITVALSGLGGDELFAGYPQYKHLPKIQAYQMFDIPSLRKNISKIIPSSLFNHAHRLKILMSSPTLKIQDVFLYYRKTFLNNQTPLKNKKTETHLQLLNEYLYLTKQNQILSYLSLLEMRNYMEHILLRDTDQMSMAHALEVRNPFLDTALIEYILNLPDHIKYPITPKKLLTDSLSEILPKNITQRKKMGFVLPFQEWMRNELKSFCEKKIFELAEQDFIDKKLLLAEWKKYQSKQHNRWWQFWHLIALQNWIHKNIPS